MTIIVVPEDKYGQAWEEESMPMHAVYAINVDRVTVQLGNSSDSLMAATGSGSGGRQNEEASRRWSLAGKTALVTGGTKGIG